MVRLETLRNYFETFKLEYINQKKKKREKITSAETPVYTYNRVQYVYTLDT